MRVAVVALPCGPMDCRIHDRRPDGVAVVAADGIEICCNRHWAQWFYLAKTHRCFVVAADVVADVVVDADTVVDTVAENSADIAVDAAQCVVIFGGWDASGLCR